MLCYLPLAEGVQAGQNLGVLVVVQADAAHQELLVYLTHHWAGAPGFVLRHGGGLLEPRTTEALNLEGGTHKRSLSGPGTLRTLDPAGARSQS